MSEGTNKAMSDPPPTTASKVIADFDPLKKPPKRNKFAFACATLASMTSVLLGYDIGVMSGAIIYLKEDWHISDTQIGVLVGILNIYCLFGSFAAGRTSDWIGRRYTIVLAGAIFFVGALLMGFATNYAFLMVGRFVTGIGVGYALMIAPVYTAEVSPASSRGFLTSFPEVFINAGILLGYISNLAFSSLPTHLSWRFMLGIGAIPSIFLAIGVLAMPESPRWLVMQGRLGDAKKVLNRISDSPEEAQLRLSEIKQTAGIPAECDEDIYKVEKTKIKSGNAVWKELFFNPTPAVRRAVIAGIGIHFFQQASGIDAVVLYSPRIFQSAGITNARKQLLATVAVGVVKTLFILVATFQLDKYGRRPLLLTSVGGMIIAILTLAMSLTVIDHSHHKITWAIALCITMVCAVVASFSIGLGPITWVYSSEVFPLRLRAQGTSMGVAVNRVVSGVISIFFLPLSHKITTGGAFFLFGGIAIIAWFFFLTFLPETRGRTLENMHELFEDFRWRESFPGNKSNNDENSTRKQSNGNDKSQVQLGETTTSSVQV
uniref:BvcDNA-397 protein n=1 Tax=Beta vulgaris subsp. vulgaris TaxID=3555 RepID=P93076_BETVV|nr:putative sugar transporter; member of major facilitative superfamily; integral membrane protein [Beta vulgaris]